MSCVRSAIGVELNFFQFAALVDVVYTMPSCSAFLASSIAVEVNANSFASVSSIVASFSGVPARRAAQAALWGKSGLTALVSADEFFSRGALESSHAADAGFVVTTTKPSRWAAMTAAQFAQYDLLVIADVNSELPMEYMSSAGVWTPVVMGRSVRTIVGNRVLFGTDPSGHVSGVTDVNKRGTVLTTGFKFAAAMSGATGIFIVASETGSHGLVPNVRLTALLATLGNLSDGSGNWTGNPLPPCGGNVSLVAAHPSFVPLTSPSLWDWGCSVHITFPRFPSDWYALGVATDTTSRPTCGTDPHAGNYACGEAYLLIAGSAVAVTSRFIALPPAPTGGLQVPANTSSFTLSVVITDPLMEQSRRRSAPPLVNATVTFTVTGQNRGVRGACTPDPRCVTAADGSVAFTYSNSIGAPGADTISISFVDSAGSRQSATFQVQWTAAPPAEPASSSSSLPTGAVVGIAVGGVVVVALVAVAVAVAAKGGARTAPQASYKDLSGRGTPAAFAGSVAGMQHAQTLQMAAADPVYESNIDDFDHSVFQPDSAAVNRHW